ncbi:hypothetical protein BGZ52_004538, partial [Haplosporangium bisporale]
MDSKKRPNDDIESSSDALDDQPMDVSDAILSAIVKEAATIHPPTVTVTVVTENTVPGEPNKRVKLTMEHDKAGDYSPSTDITDPAKETKDLTEWVDHMDEDKAPILPSKETSSPVKKDDAHPATTSDNVDPVPLVSGAPTILSDSILAVASLSEPLMTTLETLENEAQATIVPTSEDKKPEEPLNQASIEETSAHSETTEPKETKEPIVTPTTEKAPPVETIYDPIKPQEAQTIEEPKEVTQPKEPMDTFEPSVPSMPETSERPPSQQGDDIIMTQAAVEDTLPTSMPFQQQPSTESVDPTPLKEPVGTPRRDPIEPNMRHGGYNRSPIEHGHPGRQEPMLQGPPRAPREYPADEVMESGGVSGYTGHRHRLASPVGIRPDPVAGPNGKLPGLGAMNMPSSGHEHGHHPRPEGPLPPTRPGSYSPVQHASYGNVANGIMYPPSSHSGYHGHHAPNMGQVEQPRHPRLIIHSDSLKMDGRPELFLGYHRYDPATLLPNMEGNENSLLEVRIASTYLTYDNAKVRKRELWGTEVYTDDSDVVATLIHSGFYIPPLTPTSTDQDSLQPTGQHNFASLIQHICPGFDLAVTIRAMPKLEKYQGSIQNRIKSRTWSTDDHSGASFKIESIRKLPAGEALNRGRGQSKRRIKESCTERQRVLANIHDETTESLQNERAMRTATFEFTQQGYPCFKYSPELVMDRHDGLSRKWTSWRLKSAVLILENDEERYEISLQHQAGTDSRRFDQYRFAVISPRTSLPSEATYPLGAQDLVEVLYEDLDWQDFEWVERGVVVQPSNRPKKNGAMEGVDGVATNKQEVPMEVD